MTKKEFIAEVAKNLDIPATTVGRVYKEIADEIVREVCDEGKCTYVGLGTFVKSERAARTARNPLTGEAVAVEAHSAVSFRPCADFKQVVR